MGIAQSIGDRHTEMAVLNQRGIILDSDERFADARPLFEQAAKIAGAIAATSEETDALDNLAMVLGEPRRRARVARYPPAHGPALPRHRKRE